MRPRKRTARGVAAALILTVAAPFAAIAQAPASPDAWTTHQLPDPTQIACLFGTPIPPSDACEATDDTSMDPWVLYPVPGPAEITQLFWDPIPPVGPYRAPTPSDDPS